MPIFTAPPAASKPEQLDYTTLAACCHELSALWVPSKVESVVMADETTMALCLRAIDRRGWLHISWHAIAARACIGDYPERGEAAAVFPIAKAAHDRLRGQVLLAAEMMVPFDRILRLDFGLRPGDAPDMRLVCEIQGRYSNAILTDANNVVLLAARQIGTAQSAARRVRVGERYPLPPAPPGLTPSTDESLADWQANVTGAEALVSSPGDVVAAMARAYQGMSPTLARELCAVANVPSEARCSGLLDEEWVALHAAWCTWLDRVASGSFAATRDPATGATSVLGSFSEPVASVHELIEDRYRIAQAEERFAVLHAALQRAVSKAEKSIRGKLAAFDRQRSSNTEADATQLQGDLCMANVYRWPEGARELTVDDWESGEPVTIKLKDGIEGPVEHAQALFKRAGKQRRAAEQLAPLISAAEEQLEYVLEVQQSLTDLPRFTEVEDLRALQQVQEELVEQGLMPAPADAALAAKGRANADKAKRRSNKRQAAPGGADSPFRKFTAPSGLQVLIGRNNKQNDELSMRVANGWHADGDTWMHARGVPGSHLIIRVPAGQEATPEDLQFAANLSVYFSKAREAPRWDVTVCSGKDLKKPKGAKPGQVLVLKERVLSGVPSDSAADVA